MFIGGHNNDLIGGLSVVKGKPPHTTSKLLVSQTAEDSSPLNIDWTKFHNEVKEYGVVGGVK